MFDFIRPGLPLFEDSRLKLSVAVAGHGNFTLAVKRIWLNLQLAKKPVNCLEYVVVHELVHLLEKNHNAAFVDYMDKFLPNWRVTKDELNSFIMDRYLEE